MNILDIIILLITAGIALNGLRLGFVRQAARFIGFILGLVIAYRYSPDLAVGIKQLISPDKGTETSSWLSFLSMDLIVYRIVAFVLLLLLTIYVVRLIAGLLNRVVSLPGLNMLNRVTGLLLAFIQAFIIIVIIVNVMQVLPGPKMQSLLEGSVIAAWMIDQTSVFINELQN